MWENKLPKPMKISAVIFTSDDYTSTIQPPSWCTGSRTEIELELLAIGRLLTVLLENCWPNLTKLIELELVQIHHDLTAWLMNFIFPGIFLLKSIPNSLLSRSHQRHFWWKGHLSLFLLAQLHGFSCSPETHPFPGLFACCCESHLWLSAVSQLPGQTSMRVIPHYLILHPTTRFLPVELF